MAGCWQVFSGPVRPLTFDGAPKVFGALKGCIQGAAAAPKGCQVMGHDLRNLPTGKRVLSDVIALIKINRFLFSPLWWQLCSAKAEAAALGGVIELNVA